jgi:ABC-2 type transport system permease protein
MRKAFLVAKHEYLKMVRKRSFLLATLGIPLLIIGVIVVMFLVMARGGGDAPVGYVDYTGFLDPDVRLPGGEQVDTARLRQYTDEATARTALEAGEIQAFYVLAEDYLSTGQMTLYYWDDAPGEDVKEDFRDLVRANLVGGLDERVAARAYRGVELSVQSADGNREISESNFIVLFLPYIAGAFFLIAVMSSAHYLLRAVADEKENRTMEILVTSLTPEQLIGGKAVGLVCVALAQLFIWTATVVIGLAVAAQYVPFLRGIRMPWDFLALSLLYFLPSFVLMGGIMVALGSTVTEAQEGQQVAGILNMLFTSPYFLVMLIFINPDGPLSVFLTLFPTTAYITLTLRWGATVVPAWQLVVSLVLLAGTAALAVWAAARVFRVGMLSYGQRLRLPAVVAALMGR